jgi:hypothetical protein
MARLSWVLVLSVVAVACVRESPEMARKRAIREEVQMIRTFIEHQESRR